jgi:hypothetical protein
MSEPTPAQDGDPGTVPDPAPRKVSVPFRLGDGLFTRTEHVRVDPENAAMWDERKWRDTP